MSSLPPAPLRPGLKGSPWGSQSCPEPRGDRGPVFPGGPLLPHLPLLPGLPLSVPPHGDLGALGIAWACFLGKRGPPREGQRPSLTTAFSCSIPVKEVLPGIVKQGTSCLESQGQDTAGNFLLGMGTCRGSAKNPPAAQVCCLGPLGQAQERR